MREIIGRVARSYAVFSFRERAIRHSPGEGTGDGYNLSATFLGQTSGTPPDIGISSSSPECPTWGTSS
jgi:hypothetical protein